MLSDDVEIVYQFLKDEYGDTEFFPAMCRIKTALAEAQNTSTNSKSMPLICECGSKKPPIISYECPDCHGEVTN